MKQPILLRIFANDKLEGVRQFQGGQIVIGRSEDATLRLDHESVSILHAILEERDSGFYVSDLGSQGGTFRNGQRVLDEAVDSGDEIKVGIYRLQFFVGVPKPAAPPQNLSSVGSAESPLRTQMSVPQETASKVDSIPIVRSSSVEDTPPPLRKTTEVKSAEAKTAVTQVQRPQAKASKARASHGTFAPPSRHQDLKEVIKPGKGTVVEIIVAWKERIIGSYHFSEKRIVTVGSDAKCDIAIPLLGTTRAQHPLLKIESHVTVSVTQEMSGEYYQENRSATFADLMRQNKMRPGPAGYEIDLGQGDMVRVGLQGNTVSLYIRYVPEAPKPLVAPLLDFTASEVTGVILAVVVALIFGLYMMIYSPKSLEDEAMIEEPIRKAIVTFKPPRPQPKQVEEVKMDEEKPVQKKEVKVVDMEKKEKPAPKTPDPKPDPGKAAEVKPIPTPVKTKTLTSARPGGAVKTAPKDGASAQSEKRDTSKMGLLGAFGARGTQTKLDQTFSGAGELTGIADSATGYAGAAEDRAGDGMGTKLKNAGAGGNGKATIGISGVGTQGKGTGMYGYGTGGLGQKGNIDINLDGAEADIPGTIDREAIRRVIRSNYRAIKACYDRALNRKPDLYGKLVLEWDIGEQGVVLKAGVKSSTLNDREVADCIIGRLKTWRFPDPPPDQTPRISYPFVFTSQ